MFSGIIEKVGSIRTVAVEGRSRRLVLDTGYEDLALGESIAVNGVCLTVTASDRAGRAEVFVSPETLDRTNLGAVAAGDGVNLERAVSLASRLSGHLVQGHVDGRARLESVAQDGDTRRIAVSLPEGLRPYCVEKGSIALNGVSLTLNGVGEVLASGRFQVGLALIPHTWAHTNLKDCPVGAELNVEVDVIAKYVEQLCQGYRTRSNA